MNRSEAFAHAKAKGATDEEIAAETERQRRDVGTAPFRNMIKALQMHPWNNTREQWVRLAAALAARSRRHA